MNKRVIEAEVGSRLREVSDADLEYMARRAIRPIMAEIHRRGGALALRSEEFVEQPQSTAE